MSLSSGETGFKRLCFAFKCNLYRCNEEEEADGRGLELARLLVKNGADVNALGSDEFDDLCSPLWWVGFAYARVLALFTLFCSQNTH